MRDDGFRPLGGRHRNARVERIGGVDRLLELPPQLVEPLLRPAPLSVHAHRRMDERLAAFERLEPDDVGVSRRRRIEDDTAADRRPRAQDDAVAAGGHDGAREAQLREAVAGARDAGGGVSAVP